MKIFVISKVHAQKKTLMELLKPILPEVKKGAKLIFLGNYLGKGEASLETIQLIMKLSQQPNVIVLRGVWEDMVVNAFLGKDETTRKQYQHYLKKQLKDEVEPFIKELKEHKEVLSFCRSLPFYHVEPGFLFSHSGFNFEKWKTGNSLKTFLSQQTPHDLLYNQSFLTQLSMVAQQELPFYMVTGHRPKETFHDTHEKLPILSPYIRGNVINVDFGSSYVGCVQLLPTISLQLLHI